MSEARLCLICGYLTAGEPNDYDICEVCNWEDDPVQENDPDSATGANAVSVNQARLNFKEFGAVEKRHIENVRKPLPDEIPEGEGQAF